MAELTKPRAGWYLPIGSFLFHANWSKSWDGWGETRSDHTSTNILLFRHIAKKNGLVAFEFVCWRLLLMIGKC